MSTAEALRDARTITSSLRRTRRTVEYGVLQADTAVGILTKDGDAIKQTLENQKYNLKNEIEASKRRLQRVKNLQLTEKWMLRCALTFFSLVVFYISGKRLRLFQLTGSAINRVIYGSPKINQLNVTSNEILTGITGENEQQKLQSGPEVIEYLSPENPHVDSPGRDIYVSDDYRAKSKRETQKRYKNSQNIPKRTSTNVKYRESHQEVDRINQREQDSNSEL